MSLFSFYKGLAKNDRQKNRGDRLFLVYLLHSPAIRLTGHHSVAGPAAKAYQARISSDRQCCLFYWGWLN
jgi:hypothetical protein